MKKLIGIVTIVLTVFMMSAWTPKDLKYLTGIMPDGSTVTGYVVEVDVNQYGVGTFFDPVTMEKPAEVFVYAEPGVSGISILNMETREPISSSTYNMGVYQLLCRCHSEYGGCGAYFCPNMNNHLDCQVHCPVCGVECHHPYVVGCGMGQPCYCSIINIGNQ